MDTLAVSWPERYLKNKYRGKTAEEFWRAIRFGDHGDDADLGSDGDIEDWDSASWLKYRLVYGRFQACYEYWLDFLEIGESSRYDTLIDPGTSQIAFAVPSY
jgi:hypothetical protein